MPWAKLVQPSINVARYGFPVHDDLVKFMKTTYTKFENESFLVTDPAWSIDFAPSGNLLKLGELKSSHRTFAGKRFSGYAGELHHSTTTFP